MTGAWHALEAAAPGAAPVVAITQGDLLNALVAGLTAIGLVLSALGLRAWFRYGESRLGLLFAAFLGFLAQGGLLTYGLFVRGRVDDLVIPVTALSGASLLLVYLATLGRPRRQATR